MNREDMLSLKVGDMVYDCKDRYVKIVNITVENRPIWTLYRTLLFIFRFLPLGIYNSFESFLWSHLPQRIYDKELDFEDGFNCSAIHCAELKKQS